ncbi:uncharacterized protein LOC115623272 [Scaptodrosophila lebanonensis]|uniref:Uncharacterized protein LOC115623272 n=1 Tax=Drosophila lebanonensis TaxID=7225 RepID=A0A6J2T970_DROLE|nr:uncharacterized protein LOC115623272 [Scaptodrosophila lebanonensis]
MLPRRIITLSILCILCDYATGGVMDNINDGLKIAGKVFGINTAADVANLVAKAFSGATTQRKPDIMGVLRQGFQSQVDNEDQRYEQSEQDSDPENAQEVPPLQSQEYGSRQPTRQKPAPLFDFNTGQMMTNMLHMVGFDARKLGALALNALIMIAQAIGSALMQGTRGEGGLFGTSPPGERPAEENRSSGPEAIFEPNDHQPRSLRSGTPIDWFLQRPGKHTKKLVQQIMDRELPDRIVNMIEQRENDPDGGDAGCLKLLMCKSSPIIWGMQKSLKQRLRRSLPTEKEEEEEDPKGNDETEQESNSYFNTGIFFQHLPSIAEFREHGEQCEARYAIGCPRNRTQFQTRT